MLFTSYFIYSKKIFKKRHYVQKGESLQWWNLTCFNEANSLPKKVIGHKN